MEKLDLDIVSFEQAERLQNFNGFNKECSVDYCWSNTNPPKLIYIELCCSSGNDEWDYIPAPTVALALKWFREKRDVTYSISSVGHKWIWILSGNVFGSCNTYEEAENAILEEALSRSPFGTLFWIEPIYPQNDQNIE